MAEVGHIGVYFNSWISNWWKSDCIGLFYLLSDRSI